MNLSNSSGTTISLLKNGSDNIHNKLHLSTFYKVEVLLNRLLNDKLFDDLDIDMHTDLSYELNDEVS